MQDPITRQRILTNYFLNEHCLPFSLAGDLLYLSKRLAEDKLALKDTNLSSTSAMYATTHGVSKSFKEYVKLKVKGKFVSLNIDVATNKNNEKVLNILIQFYDRQTASDYMSFGLKDPNVATAIEIIKSVLKCGVQEYNIEWTQIVF
ncbi:hypothetical protein DPMN_115986 [Dreissena polymorpha]|uniref:Uncharacterized protein n=1 Tax=Dreissena polymorpha TaxID=45954 RepID=A0A9D4QUA3_DREPO|nr:hypothetical protein DPMN_115986 [Dreissena polymorpha]